MAEHDAPRLLTVDEGMNADPESRAFGAELRDDALVLPAHFAEYVRIYRLRVILQFLGRLDSYPTEVAAALGLSVDRVREAADELRAVLREASPEHADEFVRVERAMPGMGAIRPQSAG